jgi:hypothetical protein
MIFEQTVTDRTERIRLWRKQGIWEWHVELHRYKLGFRPYTDEGKAPYKWLAKIMAKRALGRLRKIYKFEEVYNGDK